MKKQITLIVLLFMAVAAVHAQDERYIKAMEKNIALLDSAQNENSLLEAANAFERIAGANTNSWLPLYYQAYAIVRSGYIQKEKMKMDEAFVKAESLINRADSLQPNNSEIYVLKSFIAGAQIMVDPMARGQKMGMLAGSYIKKAIELDSTNPRAYYLQGQSLFYTPAQFGGGADKALPYLEQAVTKYETFKPKDSISPDWGKKMASKTLEAIKKQTATPVEAPKEDK